LFGQLLLKLGLIFQRHAHLHYKNLAGDSSQTGFIIKQNQERISTPGFKPMKSNERYTELFSIANLLFVIILLCTIFAAILTDSGIGWSFLVFYALLFLLFGILIFFGKKASGLSDKKNAQYHGLEHKVAKLLETGLPINLQNLKAMPRVHISCGSKGYLFTINVLLLLPLLFALNSWIIILVAMFFILPLSYCLFLAQQYIFFTKEPTENQYQEGLEIAFKAAMKFKKSEKIT
jgi:hypothetical protein